MSKRVYGDSVSNLKSSITDKGKISVSMDKAFMHFWIAFYCGDLTIAVTPDHAEKLRDALDAAIREVEQ